MTTTPNMGLVLPDPGVTEGPEYASLNDAAFQDIDAHDHTTGSGVKVPTAGLNINASLNFNSWNGYNFRSVRMNNQASSLVDSTDIGCLYVKNGELAYRDISGNEVIMTSGGSVAGATGTITGLTSPASAAFSAVANTFSWLFDTASPARMISADLQVYPYDGATAFTNYVTLKSNTSLAANYSWIFPVAQTTQTNVVSVATTGDITYGLANGTAGAPSAAFTNDLDTGLYSVGADQLGISIGGTLRRTMSTTAETTTLPQLAANGTASAPSYAFSGAATSGLYADTNVVGLAVATGGSIRQTVNGTTIAAVSASGLSADGGSTFIKWKLYTGSLASGASTSFTPGGGAIVLGVIGMSETGASAHWYPILYLGAYGSSADPYIANCPHFISNGASGSTSVKLTNTDTNTNDYRVIVFYQ